MARGLQTESVHELVRDGFLRLPLWIVDSILPLHRLRFTALRVLIFIFRKTVGWNQVADSLPLTQICTGAGVCRRDALAAIEFWSSAGVIEVHKMGRGRATLVRLRPDIDPVAVAEFIEHAN